MKAGRLTLFAITALLLAAPIFAHHGAAAYEPKLTTVMGTITQFQFINPHALIYFDVKDASGKTRSWIAEGVSATNMARNGWNKNTLKTGDHVTVTGNCAKNGTATMRLAKLVLPDGKALMITRGEDYAGQ